MAIVLMILSFIWWWPLGLAVLAFLVLRRRWEWRRHLEYAGEGHMFGGHHGMERWERKVARAQERVERVRGRMERFAGRGGWLNSASSGNSAFDDYRTETLRRLEDEQREFKDFLSRLRFAKDRAEFDQFMAHRHERPIEPNAASEPPPAAPHA
jgi:Protein of unknown function (DUF2852)